MRTILGDMCNISRNYRESVMQVTERSEYSLNAMFLIE